MLFGVCTKEAGDANLDWVCVDVGKSKHFWSRVGDILFLAVG